MFIICFYFNVYNKLLDVLIKDCDFSVVYSDQNHIYSILKSYVGSWKQYPLVGVGADRYIASGGMTQQLKSIIQQQLSIDGYSVSKIDLLTNGSQYTYDIVATRL